MTNQNTPRGAMVMVPADPAFNLQLGWAYLDAARAAEPDRDWAFSHSGYRALITSYQAALGTEQTSSLNGKPDDYESRRSWTVKDWYTHLGAWDNDEGQLCFGSTIAFSIMLEQFHRTHTAPLLAEIEQLKGLKPEGPPRPPQGSALPHYGLRWNGPQQPLFIPMDDGYWTPWHLANQLNAQLLSVMAMMADNSDDPDVAETCRSHIAPSAPAKYVVESHMDDPKPMFGSPARNTRNEIRGGLIRQFRRSIKT